MATKEWRLGDVLPPGYKLVREVHAVDSDSREGLLNKLSEVLGKLALKVTIETRKPIEIIRMVKISDSTDIPEFDLNDLYGMVRNREIKEVEFVKVASTMQRLMDLFGTIQSAGLRPMGILVGSTDKLCDWLGYRRPFNTSLYVMGIPVTEQTDLAEDLMLVACHLEGEAATEVDVSYKVVLDPPEAKQ